MTRGQTGVLGRRKGVSPNARSDAPAKVVDPDQPVAEFRAVSFGYSTREPVLVDFDLQIRDREIVVLLGPSGCGKSTAMDLLAGFRTPNSGVVEFAGVPIRGVNTRLGYMTQGDTLLPWRTVAANVRLPLKLRGISKDEADRRVSACLSMLDLTEAAHKYPSALSGGMKRRALLARSLVYEPEMLLMDEPFAALDAQLRERMHQELLNTVNRLSQSVLFITHDLVEALTVGDRVVVMGRRGTGVRLECQIPFGKERNVEDLRRSREFFELENTLREGLREA